MAADIEIEIKPKATTTKEAVSMVADTIRNPPTTPAKMINWVGKNFSASGSLGGILGNLLPDLVGSVMPIAGAIFDIFGGSSGPDIAAQISEVSDAINKVSEQISEEARLIKAEVLDATQTQASRTVSLVAQGANEIARSESAVRVLATIEELRQNDLLNAMAAEVWAEYGDDVEKLQSEVRGLVDKAVADAQAEIDKYYAQLQAVLGKDVYDWLKLIYQNLTGEPAPTAQTRALPGVSEPAALPVVAQAPAPESGGSSMMPLLLLGAGVAIVALAKKSKKR